MSFKGQRVELYAVCAIAFAAGVPGFVWQSGEFSAVITDNGVGDVTLTLNASNGVADAEAAYGLSIRGGAANQETTGAVIGDAAGPSLDATRDKRVRLFSEVGAGAVIDADFWLSIYRRLYI